MKRTLEQMADDAFDDAVTMLGGTCPPEEYQEELARLDAERKQVKDALGLLEHIQGKLAILTAEACRNIDWRRA